MDFQGKQTGETAETTENINAKPEKKIEFADSKPKLTKAERRALQEAQRKKKEDEKKKKDEEKTGKPAKGSSFFLKNSNSN